MLGDSPAGLSSTSITGLRSRKAVGMKHEGPNASSKWYYFRYRQQRRKRLRLGLACLISGALCVAIWAWPSGAQLRTADHIVFAACVTLALIAALIFTIRAYAH